jgi:hypothetical protein
VSKQESSVQQEIRADAPYQGAWMMRNNSGVAETEGCKCTKCGHYNPPEGRPVRYGLGNDSKQLNERIKSSDLIGITPLIITPDMAGLTVGLFTAVEVKHGGWNRAKKLDPRETAQGEFITAVRQHHGLAGFATSVDDYRRIIGR